MTKSNNFMKWLLRLVGVLLVVGGIGSVFNPILKLTNKKIIKLALIYLLNVFILWYI